MYAIGIRRTKLHERVCKPALPGGQLARLDRFKEGTIIGTQVKRWPDGSDPRTRKEVKVLRISTKTSNICFAEGPESRSLAGILKETPSSFALCDVVSDGVSNHVLQVPAVPFFGHHD